MGRSSSSALSMAAGQDYQVLAEIVRRVLAEPKRVAREVKTKSNRRQPPKRRAKLSEIVLAKFAAHEKSRECLCGCKGKTHRDTRGLAGECHNQFKARKEAVLKEKGPLEAHEFDVFTQESGMILPPRFSGNKFIDLHAKWEATREAVKS